MRAGSGSRIAAPFGPAGWGSGPRRRVGAPGARSRQLTRCRCHVSSAGLLGLRARTRRVHVSNFEYWPSVGGWHEGLRLGLRAAWVLGEARLVRVRHGIGHGRSAAVNRHRRSLPARVVLPSVASRIPSPLMRGLVRRCSTVLQHSPPAQSSSTRPNRRRGRLSAGALGCAASLLLVGIGGLRAVRCRARVVTCGRGALRRRGGRRRIRDELDRRADQFLEPHSRDPELAANLDDFDAALAAGGPPLLCEGIGFGPSDPKQPRDFFHGQQVWNWGHCSSPCSRAGRARRPTRLTSLELGSLLFALVRSRL